tara:strand:- start:30 stop:269 length:240 start_codon:yes stop_codon:yes gene_type:complete
MSTYNGIATSYYTSGSENITFCIRGEHNITEDYYSLEVEGRMEKGSIWIEGTDSNGFEYDALVESCIAFNAPKGYNLIF